jgi:hypothetical protein
LALALLTSMWQVERTVQTLCRPAMSRTLDAFSPKVKPLEIRGSWQFDNLLGAMYLQIYWLMTSGGAGRGLRKVRPENTLPYHNNRRR